MDTEVIECMILGPMAARFNGGQLSLGPPRHQKILAALLLNAGQVVEISRLIFALWPDSPPGTAREQVHNGVASVRRRFVRAGAGRDAITTSFAGVTLSRACFDVDLFRASRLIGAAQCHADRRVAARQLRAALSLWAGPSLAGLTGPFFESAAAALEEQRLAALEQCLDHELETGQARQLVPELTTIVAQYPLREGFTRQLMLALYRSGRQAEALSVYQNLRLRLRDELGVQPSRAVTQLELAMLRAEAGLEPPGIDSVNQLVESLLVGG